MQKHTHTKEKQVYSEPLQCPITTTKKVKFRTQETYVNIRTGELKEMNVMEVESRDFNFHKIWLHDVIGTLSNITNKKMKVAFWIVDNLNRENQLIGTYRQIADKTGVALETVRSTMQILLENDFMRKINSGAYMINPNLLYKGTKNGRLNILTCYHDLDATPEHVPTRSERKQNIQERIQELQNELDKIASEEYEDVICMQNTIEEPNANYEDALANDEIEAS